MKIVEEIKKYNKEFVYEQYTRIVENFKDYEKVSKTKMIEEICKVYNNYNNIINICTEKELQYLKMIISNDKNYKNAKFDWERDNLHQKFLIDYDVYMETQLPEEMESNVKKAVNSANWISIRKSDRINEILVGYCKVQGSAFLDSVAAFGSGILNISEEELMQHMIKNKLFNYYVYIENRNYETIGNNIPVAVFNDYYEIIDELDKQRCLQGEFVSKIIDVDEYKIFFYNDFNIKNKTIKKFLDELEELPFFSFSVLKPIREYALLNRNRESLKESIKMVPTLKNQNLESFFKLMDKAMDEMPSGALNGLTPNEFKEQKMKEIEINNNKEIKHIKQGNACLSNEDAKLFYKLYFGLLDYTNQKYKIKPFYKIYGKTGINPYEICDIVNSFWQNKSAIIMEFCLINPFKFNKDELQQVSCFKNGLNGTFIIVEYEKEYTAIMDEEKTYMIKGLNSNIDEVISYKDLPYVAQFTIVPFKEILVYDGIMQSIPIKFGTNINNTIEKEFKAKMKYYHL